MRKNENFNGFKVNIYSTFPLASTIKTLMKLSHRFIGTYFIKNKLLVYYSRVSIFLDLHLIQIFILALAVFLKKFLCQSEFRLIKYQKTFAFIHLKFF